MHAVRQGSGMKNRRTGKEKRASEADIKEHAGEGLVDICLEDKVFTSNR